MNELSVARSLRPSAIWFLIASGLSGYACTNHREDPGSAVAGGPGTAGDAGAGGTAEPAGSGDVAGAGGLAEGGASAAGAADGGASAAGTSDGGAAEGGASAAGAAGGGSSDAGAAQECAAAGTDRTDTDHDGILDACDDDDDNDGFPDVSDPAPLDATIPGDFSTPEKILADPRISSALAKIRAGGTAFPTHQELNPPDLTGLFLDAYGTIKFFATGNGEDVGGISPSGIESRATVSGTNRLDTASVVFGAGKRYNFSTETGTLLRGTGGEFTTYAYGKSTCAGGTYPFAIYILTISSGVVEPGTGNQLSNLTLSVDVATEGQYSSPCDLGGDEELEGGWQAYSTPLLKKIAASDIQYMCPATSSAYVPGETWTQGDQTCSCSALFATSCTGP